MKNENKPIFSDPEIKSCFESLPHILQEAIMQSNIEITSAQQLRKLATELNRGK